MRPITSERYPLAGPAYQPTLKLTADAAPEIFCRSIAGPVRGSRWRTLGSRCVRAIRHFVVRATLPEPLAALRALMLNLRWSWHSSTRELFAAIDPAGRAEAGRDPAALLGEVPPEHLARLAADPGYLARLAEAASELEEYLTGPRWYQRGGNELTGAPAAVAYFSPEYGIASALPQYSGGLGILAGDHLKAASDLGVPLIGVGLLYRHGYFSQSLSTEGWQQEHYPGADPNGLPLTLLRGGRRVAGPGRGHAGRGLGAGRAGVARPGGPGAAAAARLLRGGERARPAGGHRPPLRRRERAPAPAGAAAGDRGSAGGAGVLRADRPSAAGGLPHQRGPCRLPRPGADPRVRAGRAELRRGDRGVPGRARCSPRTPRWRPASTGSPATLVEQHFGGPAGDPALPTDRVLALGAETYPGGDPEVFNMAVMGMRLAQRVNGVQPAARPGEPGDVRGPVAGLRSGRGADRVGHQRGARRHLGGAGDPGAGGRRWRVLRPGAGRGRRGLGAGRGGRPGPAVGDPPPAAGPAGGPGAGAAPGILAAARRVRCRAGLGPGRARPQRADHRLRPPGSLLQAADADAARPGAPARAPARPAAPGADRDRGQGPPGGRERQAAHPADGPVRRLRGCAAPDRVPARLRHGSWRMPWCRAATCG